MTTGEFAKLCRTTKETLFHYDRENILKARHVSEKGYRYYEAKQFLDFDTISLLKDTGSSLSEIKTYLHDTDIEQFKRVLGNKKDFLIREIRKLAHRKHLLDDMMICLQELSTAAYDTLTISEQPEELLEVFHIEKSPLGSEGGIIDSLCACGEYYAEQQRMPRGPFGVMLCQDEDARYIERFLFSRATSLTPPDLLHRKPEGVYATFFHRGTLESQTAAFEKFVSDAATSGLSISGSIYVIDMMMYSMQGSDTSYCSRYSARVREDARSKEPIRR